MQRTKEKENDDNDNEWNDKTWFHRRRGGAGGDGARKTLLVADYRGKDTALDVTVKGVSAGVKAHVRRLDHGHADWQDAPSAWDGEKLRLEKESSGSAAFLVRFE